MTAESSTLVGLLAAEPAADDVDTRILDAALAEFVAYGLRRVSVEDVAKRAGVARTTIYRRFTNKEQLLQAVVLRDTRRFLSDLSAAAESLTSPRDALVEAFVAGLRCARTQPLMSRLLQSEPEIMLPAFSMNGGAVILAAREIIADRLRQAGPDTDDDLATVSEVLLRVALSLLLVPGGGLALHDDDSARAFARDYLSRMLTPIRP